MLGWEPTGGEEEEEEEEELAMGNMLYRVSQKKHSYKIFGFGLFVVFWKPLKTDLDAFGRF